MSLTCYIVDDEFHAIEILAGFIAKTAGLELIGSSTKALKALEEVSTDIPPDIILLDVDMPDLSGLEFAGLVNHYTTVVFTTSYREYALEAFEKQALDYLLKPIKYERFLKAIQKVRNHLPTSVITTITQEPFLFVKGQIKNKFIRIQIPEIKYIIASLNYIDIYVKEQKITTYMSLNDVFGKLPAAAFSRIHKSYIVNHNHIDTVEYGQVKMSDQEKLPIGRVFRKDFHHKMNTSFSPGKYDQPG